MDTKRITVSAEETKEFAKNLAKYLQPGDVVLLYGDLGAGKTTFVQGLAQEMGIKDRIISPTFVLQRIHKTTLPSIKIFNHIDLYRIDETEIGNLGIEETIEEDDAITVIEWADRLRSFKPGKGYKIYFKTLGEDRREIEILKI